jgi:hypothetical protein
MHQQEAEWHAVLTAVAKFLCRRSSNNGKSNSSFKKLSGTNNTLRACLSKGGSANNNNNNNIATSRCTVINFSNISMLCRCLWNGSATKPSMIFFGKRVAAASTNQLLRLLQWLAGKGATEIIVAKTAAPALNINPFRPPQQRRQQPR